MTCSFTEFPLINVAPILVSFLKFQENPVSLSIQMRAVGGPDVLEVVQQDVPPPAANEVRIRHTLIGVNFIDIYHRTGLYPLPRLPTVIGMEGAGVVEALGEGVIDLNIGERIAYAGAPAGAYAEIRNISRQRLIRLPEEIPDRIAGAAMLRGLTAHMVLKKVCPVTPGEYVLVHAGAGGLGQLITRWARRLGAVVIATVGSEHKIPLAQAAGANLVLLHTDPSWPAKAKEFAEGRGVHLACDGIGGAILAETFRCARAFGTVVSLGQAAGAIPPFRVDDLGPVRSLSLARPSVIAYANDPALYAAAANDLLAALRDGLALEIGAEFPLREAAQAHAALEAGRTSGSVVLMP